MLSKRGRWFAKVVCKCDCTNAGVPTATPSTVMPCWSAGKLGFPTHVFAPRSPSPGGCWPDEFHARVLAWFSWMWACAARAFLICLVS